MQLPSKELLREVLDKDYNDRFVDWFQIEDDNYLRTYHDCGKFDEQGRPTGLGIEINIYELAHKCTEWAFDKGYLISVWEERVFGYYSEDTRKFVTFNYAVEILSNSIDGKDINFTYKFETEVEAIFAACQWILDNKDN